MTETEAIFRAYCREKEQREQLEKECDELNDFINKLHDARKKWNGLAINDGVFLMDVVKLLNQDIKK